MFPCQNMALLVEHPGLPGHTFGVYIGLLSRKIRYQALVVGYRLKSKAENRSSTEVIRKADPNKKVHLADAEARLCCITLDCNPYYCPRCLFLFDYKTKLITNVRPKNLEGNNTVAKRASYIPMSWDSIHPRAFSTFDSRGKNNSNNNLHVIIL